MWIGDCASPTSNPWIMSVSEPNTNFVSDWSQLYLLNCVCNALIGCSVCNSWVQLLKLKAFHGDITTWIILEFWQNWGNLFLVVKPIERNHLTIKTLLMGIVLALSSTVRNLGVIFFYKDWSFKSHMKWISKS